MSIRGFIDKIKPNFVEGGKYWWLQSVFEGFETFLYVPNERRERGVHIHDSIDSKRIMSIVVIALLPCLLFGIVHFGFWAVVPKIVVSYVVGLGIEFIWAQWKKEEIQEGFLVSGILIPLIVPVGCPLWMIAIAVAFAVIIGKEIFGGTGMNIFNPALLTRAFLFFSYPAKMSGDSVWLDGQTCATPLVAEPGTYSVLDGLIGWYPGCIGETSVICIAIGAVILLWSGIASWKIILSVFLGGSLTAALFQFLGMSTLAWYEHLIFGGFAFGAVFMATDPVTSCRTESGKWIFGALVGIVAIVVRVLNPGYPEGMMLAILLMNMFAPTIDHYIVESNIKARAKRVKAEN